MTRSAREQILWQPTPGRIAASNSEKFSQHMYGVYGISVKSFHSLYEWSITCPLDFWAQVWDFCGVKSFRKYDAVLQYADRMPGAEWFKGATLNFAQNLLHFRDEKPAIIFQGEEQIRRAISYSELYSQTAALANSLKALGVAPGDRVAGFMPNIPETIIAMLAAASLGAVWSSCSPDFGVSGVVDRFGQIRPKVLFCADGYFFKGSAQDSLGKVREIISKIGSIEKTVVVPYTGAASQAELPVNSLDYNELLKSSSTEIAFVELPFNHPLYVMYSSGTTGKPKCIVHGAGGTLLEHLKELTLHVDLRREDKIFYQTTCGWMMWNWLVSSLATGAAVILYDGSPMQRHGRILFDLAEKEGVTVFGTNAKYLSLVEKEGLEPGKTHNLSALSTVLSTGSPLTPESFDYVYQKIKSDVCLSSISGGTDILGCFALGSPTLPVYRGELQTRSLGLKVEVFDPQGRALKGAKGELVCTAPFPSMPLNFWNDLDGSKYRAAYFEKFPGAWHHGDYVELTQHNGMIFYGRSDTVLNPGGVRIGTAEIYAQVEKLPEIIESVAIGQEWHSDIRVILFVRLRDGLMLDEALSEKLKKHIRANASPFHVPAKIIQVPDIPRTRSGKIVELAVRDIVHGRKVTNIEALANPEALEYFKISAD